MLFDKNFEYGFKVQGTDYNEGVSVKGILDYNGTAKSDIAPRWTIAQWCSTNDISQGEYTLLGENLHKYEDPSKTLIVDTSNGAFILGYRASVDYGDTVRQDGQNWPGILLQHNFVDQTPLNEYKHLWAKFSFTITSSECKMNARDIDYGRHAAQLQWYLNITNKSHYTGILGDYYWFGISMYDTRGRCGEYKSADSAGVETSTNKAVYCFDQAEWLKTESIEIGKKYEVIIDLLPHIKTGFDYAVSAGYLEGCVWEGMYVQGMNIGWELPGTYDVETKIDYISLLAEYKN